MWIPISSAAPHQVVSLQPELCRALPAPDPAAPLPERLLLAPAGPFTGRDGRAYAAPDLPALAAALNEHGADLPLDWEHATELAAPQGQRADAAAWLRDFRADPEGLTAAVDWTPAGAESVRARAYRYYSPAYLIDPATRAVVGLTSAGLTNRPNLRLPALNHQELSAMLIPEPIRQALDLPATASADEAAAHIASLKTELNQAQAAAATPDLGRYVPRADYDAALNRAAQAETALRDVQAAELERQIETLLQEGLTAARLTPATLDYHRAQARSEGGLERLRQYLAAAPTVLAPPAPAGAPPAGDPELNRQQAAIAAAFGNTPETLAKFGARP